MHKLTHFDLASLLMKSLEKYFGIRLRKTSFKTGSIIPDISPSYFGISHFFKEPSIDFLINTIEDIMKYRVEKSTLCSKEFSKKLGIVMHYLCDFFCYAHSDHFRNGFILHYIYELKLAVYYKKELKKHMNFLLISPEYDSVSSHATLNVFLKESRKKYHEKVPSYINDISFSSKISMSVLYYIIGNCISDNIDTVTA